MQSPTNRKIGIYLDFSPQEGGTFQYVLCLLEALRILKLSGEVSDVHVAYLDDHWLNIIPKEFRSFEIKIGKFWKLTWRFWFRCRLPIGLWQKSVAPLVAANRQLLSAQVNLWIFPCQDQMSLFYSVKTIVAVHDLMHIYEARFPELVKPYAYRQHLYRNIGMYAAKILVDSNLGKSQFEESYPEHKAKIFPLPYIPPTYIRENNKLQEISSVSDKKFFFYPAQFWSHKNHKNLLQAFAEFRKSHSDIYLIFSGGKQNAFDEVHQKIVDLGLQDRVLVLGYVSNEQMLWLYHNCIGMIFPSFIGPTNIPPLEALFLGVPCACSGIYAVRESTFEKLNYFNPENVNEILIAMENLILQNRKKPNELIEIRNQLSIDQFSKKLKVSLFS